MQTKILKDLGEPIQVTPYAANTTGQAALSLWNELEGKDRFKTLYPGIVNYLVGEHGKVPDTINQELIEKALKMKGISETINYKSSLNRESKLESAHQDLLKLGIKDPNIRQKLSFVLLDKKDHVINCYKNQNISQEKPKLTFFATKPVPFKDKKLSRDG
jgi:pyruvate/oxaloacetate carboxyltransferase